MQLSPPLSHVRTHTLPITSLLPFFFPIQYLIIYPHTQTLNHFYLFYLTNATFSYINPIHSNQTFPTIHIFSFFIYLCSLYLMGKFKISLHIDYESRLYFRNHIHWGIGQRDINMYSFHKRKVKRCINK